MKRISNFKRKTNKMQLQSRRPTEKQSNKIEGPKVYVWVVAARLQNPDNGIVLFNPVEGTVRSLLLYTCMDTCSVLCGPLCFRATWKDS
jgi:predicted enzyme involved in methoxymalonyl-ACP biosynthesis